MPPLTVLITAASAQQPAAVPWTVLQTEQVRVQCRGHEPGSECEAHAWIGADVDQVCGVLEDLMAWPTVFATVRGVQRVSADTYALDVNLPFPLGAWPFEAKVEHEVDPLGHHVRLVQVSTGTALWRRATWTVVPEGKGSRIVYAWHSEALTGWPGMLRNTLLRRTGHNTVWAVALAADSEPTAR
ncbi:MAG: hypothetical protein KTR31_31430 [Myxococcales bacterium]|nr:hypothetical protein [Myxococcales bacterium]